MVRLGLRGLILTTPKIQATPRATLKSGREKAALLSSALLSSFFHQWLSHHRQIWILWIRYTMWSVFEKEPVPSRTRRSDQWVTEDPRHSCACRHRLLDHETCLYTNSCSQSIIYKSHPLSDRSYTSHKENRDMALSVTKASLWCLIRPTVRASTSDQGGHAWYEQYLTDSISCGADQHFTVSNQLNGMT